MGLPIKTQKQQLEEKIRGEWYMIKLSLNEKEKEYFVDRYMTLQNQYRDKYGKDYLPVDCDMEVKR